MDFQKSNTNDLEGKNAVYEKVKEILCENFDVKESDITMDTDFVKDLEADSLDLVDLISSVEDKFGIEIGDDFIFEIKTVSDVVKYINDNNIDLGV